jgi:CheY-like chemotaxis protein/DNA-binding MarR family transcriptional regulator
MSNPVLLVEDDKDLASELVESAHHAGIPMFSVSSAAEAIRVLGQRAELRTVVTDIMLGDISGLELLRKLARLAPERRVRSIVLSGYSTVDHVLNALRLGVVDFLPKPIMPEEFIDAVRRAQGPPAKGRTEGSLQHGDAAELLLKARQKRDSIFGPELFEDPAWNIMLDLYSSTLSGRTVTVSDLCIASGTSSTTALRRLGTLAEMGLIARIPDASDRRRVLVTQTQAGREAMDRFSDWFRNEVNHKNERGRRSTP